MSFLSFLSSHRLHSTHRPWIDPLPVQLDLFLHDQVSVAQADRHVLTDDMRSPPRAMATAVGEASGPAPMAVDR